MSPSLGTFFTPTSVFFSLLAIVGLSQVFKILCRRAHTMRRAGPPSSSWIFGAGRVLRAAADSASLYEGWSRAHGSVYALPAAFGTHSIVLMDPKAIAHCSARDTYGYFKSNLSKLAIQDMIGKGLLWADGGSHKRQRKTLTPAFSNITIRRLTPIFFDSAYKVKATWDGFIEAGTTGESVTDVQTWYLLPNCLIYMMNRVSLDSIGLAGFAHDFGTLRGENPTVAAVFDAFGHIVPWLIKLPTHHERMVRTLNRSMGEIADVMLERERRAEEKDPRKSVIGLLLKAEGNEEVMTQDEIMAQMKVMLLAGYETTSISLTWALIELSKNQQMQTKLREELAQFGASDPTWDQLANSLPYLDAIVHGTLRTHAPVGEISRVAMEDDVVPLSMPALAAAGGATTDRISITRGTIITVPIRAIHLSEDIWGPDAKMFKPERWLSGDEPAVARVRELSGHRHLLTFFDSSRICIGKNFALAEIKVVLFVLVRSFVFEPRDGPETKIKTKVAIMSRPTIKGEEGAQFPLRVRRLA
ncbi:cytochrome P450 monooxygenase 102 [Heterobasidion irregulare TC 32-1]|uniref:Cytochrome P450 monooxygenase 102 n=1 Tax=Heterobasidion irregulare (strain TC 32-1) TaxID=747525 RepID=W4KI19_HETIT|nr:cytochrome P450 monooxygenase 102 [Heterobasidion irregulare TC 32-1]ETW84721.1 cytochrome P450 monooxygenase 102 [Heterobasidion irregulare TC 32-1]